MTNNYYERLSVADQKDKEPIRHSGEIEVEIEYDGGDYDEQLAKDLSNF